MENSNDVLIQVEALSYYYPHAPHPALKDISFTIRRGELVGLIGPSGAGKTTLCLALSGLIPQALGGRFFGQIRIAGLDTVTTPMTTLARHVGMVFEDPKMQFVATTVESEVAFALENLALPQAEIRARVERALSQVGLRGLERRSPQSLSGGQSQRLAIAALLALEPPMLILDEPTAQLDPQGAEEVFAVLRALHRRGMTLVVASHAAEALAASAQRLLLLDEGTLVAVETPAALYGVPERVRAHRLRPPQVAEVYAALGWHPAPVCWTKTLPRPRPASSRGANGGEIGTTADAAATQLPRCGTGGDENEMGIVENAFAMGSPRRRPGANDDEPSIVENGTAARLPRRETGGDDGGMGVAGKGDAHGATVPLLLSAMPDNHPTPLARPSTPQGSLSSPLLELSDVQYTYPDGTAALRGIHLAIGRGDFVALLGANGAGKTTLVRLVMHLLKPTRGEVRWEGTPTTTWTVSDMARRIGYVAQQPERQLFGLSVEEEVAFALRYRGLPAPEIAARVEEALGRFGLERVRSAHPLVLPRGERARVVLAAMVALRPQMLMLDEPTVGQDEASARAILEAVRELHAEGMTVVLITHHLHLLPGYATRAVVLRAGEVVLDGPLRTVLHDETALRACGLYPPQVVRMARAWGVTALTPQELVTALNGGVG